VEFLFDEGTSLADCLARLQQNKGWGQIRGPHGSGKSTLVCDLIPHLEEQGRRVALFTLHDGERRLPASRKQLKTWDPRTQVVIDGFEQLSRFSRWRLKRVCRRQGCGLLITAHGDFGFPDIQVTTTTVERAQRVAARLLHGWPPLVGPEDIERSFAAHEGDLREAFFALYDVYERRKSVSRV
jgi:hypothetical protein